MHRDVKNIKITILQGGFIEGGGVMICCIVHPTFCSPFLTYLVTGLKKIQKNFPLGFFILNDRIDHLMVDKDLPVSTSP